MDQSAMEAAEHSVAVPQVTDLGRRIDELERERRHLLDRLQEVRQELAQLQAARTSASTPAVNLPPPSQWSQVTVSNDDIENVLRQAPETTWTVAEIRKHLPNASEAQIRSRLKRLTRRGLVQAPSRGRYVLAQLSPEQYRKARGPRKTVRERILDLIETAPTRTRQDFLDELQDVHPETVRLELASMVRNHELTLDARGYYRPFPVDALKALVRRPDSQLEGLAAGPQPTTRTANRRTNARSSGSKGHRTGVRTTEGDRPGRTSPRTHG